MINSRNKVLPVFISNLVLNIMNMALIKIFSFGNNYLERFQENQVDLIFNFTIINDFTNYFIFISIFANILGLFSNIIMMTYFIEKRGHDIGLMKSLGILRKTIIGIFTIPLIIILFLSYFFSYFLVKLFFIVLKLGNEQETNFEIILFMILFLFNSLSIFGTLIMKINWFYRKNARYLIEREYLTNIKNPKKISITSEFF
ncbi:MAG: hypothetical protein ACTSRA_08645, partial [Promethearchaeota archaeon]